MTIVMAFGKFGLVHPGHVRYLQEAKKFGDKLVVVVARQEHVAKNLPGEEQRREVVEALEMVDEAVLGGAEDKYEVIEKYCPDVIVLGPDQEEDEDRLAFELQKRGLKCKVVRVPHLTEGELHKTSKMVKKIRE